MVRSFVLLTVIVSSSHAAIQAAQTIDYDAQIRPILQDRCYSCHGPAKHKAKLRLDSPNAILKGTPDGPVVIPGESALSELLRRVALPADDYDIMPPQGKPLTAEQVALIRDWINQGASFGSASTQPVEDVSHRGSSREPEGPVVPPADPAALQRLRDAGAWVTAIDGQTHRLSVSFRHRTGLHGANALALLAGAGEQIAWLDLGHSDVSDAALRSLGGLKNLTRLNLEKTAVSDEGLASLSTLHALRYLNLYGTPITDAGLARLASLPNLRDLYLWQTQATPAGVERLRRERPKLRVMLAAALTTTPAGAPSSPEPATSGTGQ